MKNEEERADFDGGEELAISGAREGTVVPGTTSTGIT
jgi:hypothetical protein